ncbi:alpha/beta fold hydrolase [Aquipuribacter sp. MA13-6]|uniref:alpha/beta fold hydrolase n=1 Tax=unclassified Aquipuribacter TaxID=2635084 RepID=UPI003EED379F
MAVCEPPAGGSAEAPLVLLLHGALQNWYAWRGVLPGLAAAGYRAVAADLRGHGASDATPRGYDLPGLADDVDALVRSLGAQRAVVVGHDLGGWVGWTLAARHPERLSGLVAVAAPQPRPALLTGGVLRAVLSAQAPSWPERVLLHGDGIRSHLDAARATPAPRADVEYYLASVRVPSVAHTCLEPWRWLARASPRPDGVRWWRSVRPPVAAPVLQLDGGRDPWVRTGSDDPVPGGPGSARAVVADAGHLLPEEAPAAVLEHLLAWLPGVLGPQG